MKLITYYIQCARWFIFRPICLIILFCTSIYGNRSQLWKSRTAIALHVVTDVNFSEFYALVIGVGAIFISWPNPQTFIYQYEIHVDIKCRSFHNIYHSSVLVVYSWAGRVDRFLISIMIETVMNSCLCVFSVYNIMKWTVYFTKYHSNVFLMCIDVMPNWLLISTPCIAAPLWGNLPVSCELFSQRTSKAEIFSISRPRHDVTQYKFIQQSYVLPVACQMIPCGPISRKEV